MAANRDLQIRLLGDARGLGVAAREGSRHLRGMRLAMQAAKTGNLQLTESGRLLAKTIGENGKVQVRFIGDLSLAKKALQAHKDEVLAVEKTYHALSQGMSEADQRMLRAVLGINNVSASLGSTANMTGAATFALTSLGQGLGDAGQFSMGFAQGIRAITNNLQQVGFAVMHLSTQIVPGTEDVLGFKGALLQMKKTLVGPLGILFAFQLLTVAVEVFANLSQRAKKDTEDLTSAIDDAAAAMIKVGPKSLDSFRASGQAIDKAISKLKGLTDDYDTLEEQAGRTQKALKSLAGDLPLVSGDLPGDRVQDSTALLAEASIIEAAKARIGAITETERERVEANRAILKHLEEQKVIVEANLAIAEAARALGLEREEGEEDAKNIAKKRLDIITLELQEYGKIVDKVDEYRQKAIDLSTALSLGGGVPVASALDSTALRSAGGGEADGGFSKRLSVLQTYDESIRGALAKTNEWKDAWKDGIIDSGEAERLNEVATALENVGEKGVTAFQSMSQVAQAFAQSFTTIGTSMMQMAQTSEGVNQKMFERGKAMAIAGAIINTAQGITNALAAKTIHPAINFGLAAAVAAAGAAQIAVIRATRPGSASGGGRASVSSAPGFVAGISNVSQIGGGLNLGQTVAGAGLSGRSASGLPVGTSFGAPTAQTARLTSSGRDLVLTIKNEIAAQKRLGVRDPLGIS